MVEEDDDLNISINEVAAGVVPVSTMFTQPIEPDLTGAIVLNDTDNAIALQSLDAKVGTRRPVMKNRNVRST